MGLNIPAGVTIFGANLTTSPARLPIHQDVNPWTDMYSDPVWDNVSWPYIKNQIDHISGNGIGCNAFRILGSGWAITKGVLTQEAYDAKIVQLVAYLKSKGLFYFHNWATVYDSASDPVSNLVAAKSCATTLLKIQGFGNVAGCDFIQECQTDGSYGFSNAYLLGAIQHMKSLGVTVPLTCSNSDPLNTASIGRDWLYAIAAGLDYIDCHVYTQPTPGTHFAALRAMHPTKEILIGEVNLHQGHTQAERTQILTRAFQLATAADPMMRGVLVWSAADDHTSATPDIQWGIADENMVLRQESAHVLRQFIGGSLAKSLATHR